jgi:alpha-glucosidase
LRSFLFKSSFMSAEKSPGRVLSIVEEQSRIALNTSEGCIIEFYFLTEDILRIRYLVADAERSDFSYAIDSRFKVTGDCVKVSEENESFILQGSKIRVIVNQENSGIRILDKADQLYCEDERGFHWEEHQAFGGNIVKMGKVVQEGEHFYGMGDKTMHLNLRGRRVTNWAMDVYGFKKEEDPIYKAIPFYLGVHHGRSYGIFFDNTFRSHFDFGSERRSVTSFWAEGGEMNYYFIAGPEMIDVVRHYTSLTGVPELPPMWALGYQQSKWSYSPQEKVLEIAAKLRDNAIPCDAIYLDIDYMSGFRCFTWDGVKFPEPAETIRQLKETGFKTVAIVDPGIKVDPEYYVFQEGVDQNYFCRRADGPYMKGKVWPGDCYFPDFTHPRVRKWWSGLCKDFIEKSGIRGIWNDMNEPALFEIEGKTFPDDVRHDYDGNPCSHRKAHNVYGMQMVRATSKAWKKSPSSHRPLVITRSAYAGTQRYAASWTGDNIASWEHLWLATMHCQRLSISGFSFIGTDVGGFIDHPSPELYLRWMQLATFHPFFRTHSSGDHGEQEPWSFGEEALRLSRDFIELRYRLLPYMYTAFYQYITRFTPVIRPLSMVDQHDSDTLYRVDEFMVGDHLLLCPVLEPNVRSRYVYIPRGRWTNFWTNESVDGGKEILVDAPLEQIPLFVRQGAVIPFYPVMQFVGEKPIDQLTLLVYFGGDKVVSELYEDAGDGYEYQKGVYNMKTWKTYSTEDSFKLQLKSSGHYEPTYSTYQVIVKGLAFSPSKIWLNEVLISTEEVFIENQIVTILAERSTFNSLRIEK